MSLTRPLITALIVLPGNALVVAPALIVWFTRGTPYAAGPAGVGGVALSAGVVAAAAGFTLMGRTMADFLRVGRGTPAPWAPPTRLVVRGPYRHVRNPMISGVCFTLLAEALIAGSWPFAGWGAFFLAANAFYIPRFEEPGLERRFGEDYQRYRENVPRWLPRLGPWRG